MRPVEWRKLLADERVPFIERGANVKRGEINIRCPFCGSADPSYHMGLNLETGWWSCWRNRAGHSGKSPLRLLMKLLSIPYWRAREIAGLSADYIDPEGFDAVAARLLGRFKGLAGDAPKTTRRLSLPKDFKLISDTPRCRRHLLYLADRGFDFIYELIEEYDLMMSPDGIWADRIIIPYRIDELLVTWSARAIGRATIRYLDLPIDEALVPAKEMLFNYDCIAEGGRVLILVEGPVDALKIDFHGRSLGVRAVALSTNSLSEEQLFMLEEATDQFDQRLVMMDQGLIEGMVMSGRLAHLGFKSIRPPYGLKDAGAMDPGQAIRWLGTLLGGD